MIIWGGGRLSTYPTRNLVLRSPKTVWWGVPSPPPTKQFLKGKSRHTRFQPRTEPNVLFECITDMRQQLFCGGGVEYTIHPPTKFSGNYIKLKNASVVQQRVINTGAVLWGMDHPPTKRLLYFWGGEMDSSHQPEWSVLSICPPQNFPRNYIKLENVSFVQRVINTAVVLWGMNYPPPTKRLLYLWGVDSTHHPGWSVLSISPHKILRGITSN